MDVPLSCLISEGCVSFMIISSMNINTIIDMNCDYYSALLLIMMTLMTMTMMMMMMMMMMMIVAIIAILAIITVITITTMIVIIVTILLVMMDNDESYDDGYYNDEPYDDECCYGLVLGLFFG